MEGREKVTDSSKEGLEDINPLTYGEDASPPKEKSHNLQLESGYKKQDELNIIQAECQSEEMSNVPGEGVLQESEVGGETCDGKKGRDKTGKGDVEDCSERTAEEQSRVLLDPWNTSGPSKVTDTALGAEGMSRQLHSSIVERNREGLSDPSSLLSDQLGAPSQSMHDSNNDSELISERTRLERVKGSPGETKISKEHLPIPDSEGEKGKISEIAEKLRKLESELDVNMLDQFEAFVRSWSDGSRVPVTDKSCDAQKDPVLPLPGRESPGNTAGSSSGGEEDGLQAAIALAIARKKKSLMESLQAEGNLASPGDSMTVYPLKMEVEANGLSLGGTVSTSTGKREKSSEWGSYEADHQKCARLDPAMPDLEEGRPVGGAVSNIISPAASGGVAQEIIGPTEEGRLHPVMETDAGQEQQLADADRLVQTCTYHYQDPQLLASAEEEFIAKKNNFLKGCKWSPDGTCVLTNSDDGTLRLFNLPPEFYSPQPLGPGPSNMKAVLEMAEGEIIYDYSWFPQMSSLAPETCCFASTSRGHPVHMWDAFTGQLRCSYRPHDHMDELISPHSLGFSLDGTKLYCGCNKLINIFDTSRPGKACEAKQTKGKLGGQTGIISCFAMSPDGETYAAGSYSRTIGIYTDSCPSAINVLSGQSSGVTQLMYSIDGTKLYSGGRKDNEILCWDVRRSNEVLFSLKRNVTTNQRIYFDIDRDDHYLVTGNQDGSVSVWDLYDLRLSAEGSTHPLLEPHVRFTAHEDTTNGVSIHPWLPLLATASGQRLVPPPTDAGSDGEDDGGGGIQKHSESITNSLKIWSLYDRAGS